MIELRKKPLVYLCLLFIFVCLTGCVSVPFIQAYKDIGASPSDRQELLTKKLKDFNTDRYWGRSSQALGSVAPEAQAAIRNELLRAKRSEERIVESNVELVDFDEDSYKATVDLAVKYFSVPSYIVNKRFERQTWVFTISDGWKMQSLKLNSES